MAEIAPAQPLSAVEQLVRNSAKRTREIFAADFASHTALDHTTLPLYSITPSTVSPSTAAEQVGVATRIRNEYEHVRELPPALAAKMAASASTAVERRKKIKSQNAEEKASDPKMHKMIEGASEKLEKAKDAQSMQLSLRTGGKGAAPNAHGPTPMRDTPSSALVRKDTIRPAKPEWHRPWKLKRVVAGSMGWVRSVCVDPDNQFFATGSSDRTIKIWVSTTLSRNPSTSLTIPQGHRFGVPSSHTDWSYIGGPRTCRVSSPPLPLLMRRRQDG
jgi:pleiotropic regulator 1